MAASNRRRGARPTGPGAAARAAGARRKGPAARSDRPRTRPAMTRSSPGETSTPPAAAGAARAARTRPRHGASAAKKGERRSGIWRQVAVLGLVLAAVASAIAVPLRGYLDQRGALAQALAEQHALEERVAELTERKAALQDPSYVKAEARRRLQYVSPGETVYRIVVEGEPVADPAEDDEEPQPLVEEPEQPWYGQMWDTLTEDVPDGG